MSQLPAYLPDGSLWGTIKWEGQTSHLVPVRHKDGRWGRRTFVFKSGGYFQQVDPTEWETSVRCRKCGRTEDDPIHIKDDK